MSRLRTRQQKFYSCKKLLKTKRNIEIVIPLLYFSVWGGKKNPHNLRTLIEKISFNEVYNIVMHKIVSRPVTVYYDFYNSRWTTTRRVHRQIVIFQKKKKNRPRLEFVENRLFPKSVRL